MKTVAVLDDDQALVELFQTVLEEEGYAVHAMPISNHLSKVLAKISAVHPDILILDIHIPGLNSFDIVKNIQIRPEMAKVKVLICSASRPSLNTLQEMLTNAGLTPPLMLEKPFDLDELSKTIGALLGEE